MKEFHILLSFFEPSNSGFLFPENLLLHFSFLSLVLELLLLSIQLLRAAKRYKSLLDGYHSCFQIPMDSEGITKCVLVPVLKSGFDDLELLLNSVNF